MVLNAANQLSTTALPQRRNPFHTSTVQKLLHASMAQESFMVLDVANLWHSMHPTNSIQPSVLPWRRNLYGTRRSQPAQYNPPRFHGVRTISTLSWCRNYSMHPWRRNLLWYSMKPTSLLQPFTLPWRRNLLWYLVQPTSSIQPSTLPQCRNFSTLPWQRNLLRFLLQPTSSIQPSKFPRCRFFYGTRYTQPTRYNLPHTWRRNPFMILDVANQLGTTFHTSTVLELLRFQGIEIFYGTQCSQPAQYNPSHFHSIETLSTLPRCSNCTLLPWHRNLLRYSMQPIYVTQCI